MIDALILVRHGKAEKRSDSLEDVDRALTAAGRRSLEAAYPRVLPLVDACAPLDISVWSSPATRALQTSEIIVSMLGARIIEEHVSLYDDGIDQFIAELSQARGTVVAVGHNPFLEEVSRYLTGTSVTFDKGAMAAFVFPDASAPDWHVSPDFRVTEDPGEMEPAHGQVNDDEAVPSAGDGAPELDGEQVPTTAVEPVDLEGCGELAWFVQGPDTSRWKTLVKMEEALHEASRRVSNLAWAFLDDPDDPESLHRYRVSIRTARSLLAFVEPYQDEDQNRRIRRLLKKLQDPTSRLRELDILTDELSELDLSDDSDPDLEIEDTRPEVPATRVLLASLPFSVTSNASPEPTTLLEACEVERDAERARFVAKLSKPPMQKTLRRAVGSMREIEWRDDVVDRGLDVGELRHRFDLLYAGYAADLAAMDFNDIEEVHRVRKDAKSLRYSATAFESLLGSERGDTVNETKSMQTRLGEFCDIRVNQKISAELALAATDARVIRQLDEFDAIQENRVRDLVTELAGAGTHEETGSDLPTEPVADHGNESDETIGLKAETDSSSVREIG